MNQKIVGIIPLMVAMMFVAVFAAGDNSAAAADTATQNAKLTVVQNIGITVSPDATMTATSTGGNVQSNSYVINNSGNSRIDVSIKSGAAFNCLTSHDTIPVTAAGSTGYYITINSKNTNIPSGSPSWIIYNLPTYYQSPNGCNVSATQTLNVPAGIEQGIYTNTLTYTAITNTTMP